MSSSNRSRRANGRHRLPPLPFEEQPAAQQDEQPADTSSAEPEPADTEQPDQLPTDQPDGATPAPAPSRRDRRRRSPAAPENIGPGGGRADAKPAVTRQPFRHRSR